MVVHQSHLKTGHFKIHETKKFLWDYSVTFNHSTCVELNRFKRQIIVRNVAIHQIEWALKTVRINEWQGTNILANALQGYFLVVAPSWTSNQAKHFRSWHKQDLFIRFHRNLIGLFVLFVIKVMSMGFSRQLNLKCQVSEF